MEAACAQPHLRRVRGVSANSSLSNLLRQPLTPTFSPQKNGEREKPAPLSLSKKRAMP